MESFCTFVLLFVILFLTQITVSNGSRSTSINCIEAEGNALLKFKKSLRDPSRRLSSWVGQNCCGWEGVSCNNITDHVIKLNLRAKDSAHSNKTGMSQRLIGHGVDSALLNLKQLTFLDLSGNDFQGSEIPKFIGSMKQLRYLFLSGAGFSGLVPHQLGNLTSLRVLDLKGSGLFVDGLEWVACLSNLLYLDMSGLDLSEADNLIKVLNQLPSLLELRLSRCELNDTHLSHAHVNSTLPSLKYLDLSSNSLERVFPSVLQNMSFLEVLDLSKNYINSSIPLWLADLKRLVNLNLHDNYFRHAEGGIWGIMGNPCKFKVLDISYNLVYEELQKQHANFSSCIIYELETLNLSANGFYGPMPHWIGEFRNLKFLDLGTNRLYGKIPASLGRLLSLRELHLPINLLNETIPASLGMLSALRALDLSGNDFSGSVPDSLGQLSNLDSLDISDNNLSGTVPDSLGQLSNLKTLYISDNSLQGILSETHFANLSSLKELSARNNFLNLKVQWNWVPSFQLIYMDLCNNSISGTLPKWLGNMNLTHLDISNNQISGPIPEFPSSLTYIDLSNNQISGVLSSKIGSTVSSLRALLLANNHVNGSIPNSLCKLRLLEALDLQNNSLSGTIPNCWGRSQHLILINLSSNNLSGVVPNSFGLLSSLRFLHLNNNTLHGELPSSLSSCTHLSVLDLGDNKLSGKLPTWFGENLLSLEILRLRSNMLSGSIPLQLCSLSGLLMLDLADNDLAGTIPLCFHNLSGMVEEPANVFRLTATAHETRLYIVGVFEVLKGEKLEFTSTMSLVLNLDLSNNNLAGPIPDELTNLSGLIGLNLSHNHLTGSIPMNIGQLKSLESLDLSQNELSGTIPQSMSALISLSALNLSYNQLSGEIPTGRQLQTLDDPSIYFGNPELCGDPLPSKCTSGQARVMATTEEEDEYEESRREKIWFYTVVVLGFGTGFWGVFGVLLAKKSWRNSYFRLVEDAANWIYVEVAVRARSVKKMVVDDNFSQWQQRP